MARNTRRALGVFPGAPGFIGRGAGFALLMGECGGWVGGWCLQLQGLRAGSGCLSPLCLLPTPLSSPQLPARPSDRRVPLGEKNHQPLRTPRTVNPQTPQTPSQSRVQTALGETPQLQRLPATSSGSAEREGRRLQVTWLQTLLLLGRSCSASATPHLALLRRCLLFLFFYWRLLPQN